MVQLLQVWGIVFSCGFIASCHFLSAVFPVSISKLSMSPNRVPPGTHSLLPGDFLSPLPTSSAPVLLPGTIRLRLSSEVTPTRIPTLISFRLYEASVPLAWAPQLGR